MTWLAAEDRAAALARASRKLRIALLALETFEMRIAGRASESDRLDHEALVHVAADALWQLIVQREAGGLIDHEPVMREFDVPAGVRRRMGACPPPRRAE